MKLTDLMTSKFLKQSDIPEDRLVTVKELKKQNVARDDEDAEYKFTIFFEEFEKGMVLNSTNIKRLGKALGDETDAWPGKKVILYVDPDVEYAGQIVGGLRVRAKKAAGTTTNRLPDDDGSVPF